MFTDGFIQVGLYMLVLLLLTKPTGQLIYKVMETRCLQDHAWLGAPERLIYRLSGVDPKSEMGWKSYAVALLLFNVIGVFFVFMLQLWQAWLPLNPEQLASATWDSAFNTAVSFVTNTNWQGYGGETTMSYFTQMTGLAVQNFVSAATGIAVVIALIRGFARSNTDRIGNFWVDLTRCTLYLLVPISLVLATIFMQQGVIQNFSPYVDARTVESTQYEVAVEGSDTPEQATTQTQHIAMGPVASQEAIKMLGTNGGGFFNVNSAHPFENPTPLTNFIQMLAIFLIPAGLCYAFGMMVGDRRQGWAIFAAMAILFVVMAGVTIRSELIGNPLLASAGAETASSLEQAGGNMEGKETRFGVVTSALFATITTAASCGAVNAMHDSFTPIGGMIPMWLMQLGEVVFGGVGSGLYTMLTYAVIAVFVAGLMIGRTPEYQGKKIEVFEMKMSALIILVTPLLVLLGTAISLIVQPGLAGIANPGAHGLSEILYAYSSAANNNGSAFAGLSANTPFYNLMLATAMWFGRFGIIVPVLAIAGSLAAKKRIAPGLGTLPTHGPLFIGLLIGAVILVGALTYIPALALGPGIEHLMLFSQQH
ncbi:potassium-transporting ATPase subunit KdpA [Methylophilus sp. 14]|uniref:potassium-transporting ATPase subunit KdpA n=1 Tax=Methylophilus sp. 14 TaxID=2781019 RepID=UPI00188F4CF9|nr:potassium-transporting ATPase subunit KdpA [Methylophilus sp. 14]MBF4987081.1 potassium-transporting ATPase subunit KdpA [Methylophilus sp. 14]